MRGLQQHLGCGGVCPIAGMGTGVLHWCHLCKSHICSHVGMCAIRIVQDDAENTETRGVVYLTWGPGNMERLQKRGVF